jgi:hypothetical protein
VDRDAAKLVVFEAYNTVRIANLPPFLEPVCSPEEYEILRMGIGRVAAKIGLEVLNPLYETNPGLKSELDERLKRTG